MKKGIGSGSIRQRYGSGDPDPDPHQNVTDPQHWLKPGPEEGADQAVAHQGEQDEDYVTYSEQGQLPVELKELLI